MQAEAPTLSPTQLQHNKLALLCTASPLNLQQPSEAKLRYLITSIESETEAPNKILVCERSLQKSR